ncbi:hypothetical protein N7474_010271 [Penicillium riverlandense]|uniref:uncharacterized protein n=1 Tax=Penicillium riverlandense TaxID=1903569 RepID=UPI0025469A65|nr:uncharacterized protein N7474_010271 [Penicillium riverlandense]KAJ5809002.1 hypothetical protein N7474_010271 [Penicillium riverlandense]
MNGSNSVAFCGQQLVGVSIAIAVVQILIVALRFYTRHMQRLRYGADDYLIIPALLASLGQSALYTYLVKRGAIGYHLKYVERNPERMVILGKGLYANEILDFPFTVTPAKISILLFYIRIFDVPRFRILASIVGAIVLCHGIGVLFAAIFQCKPIAYTWDMAIPGGSCFDQEAFYRYVSPPNILTDILILIMPLPYVWKLHTRIGQKMALTGVFLLGSLGTVASVLRMTIFFQESAMTDPTWTSVKLGIWTILEGGVIIIAACLPAIWPLFSKMVPRRLLTNSSSKQLPRHQYNATPRTPKGSSGFSRLGDSTEGSKWPLNQRLSHEVDSDRHTEEISLDGVSRVHEA